MINIISLVLGLLVPLLKQMIDNKVAQEVVESVQAAVDALRKVQGTPITYQQIEGLRFGPEWGPDVAQGSGPLTSEDSTS